jgi:hypothetical protein
LQLILTKPFLKIEDLSTKGSCIFAELDKRTRKSSLAYIRELIL